MFHDRVITMLHGPCHHNAPAFLSSQCSMTVSSQCSMALVITMLQIACHHKSHDCVITKLLTPRRWGPRDRRPCRSPGASGQALLRGQGWPVPPLDLSGQRSTRGLYPGKHWSLPCRDRSPAHQRDGRQNNWRPEKRCRA